MFSGHIMSASEQGFGAVTPSEYGIEARPSSRLWVWGVHWYRDMPPLPAEGTGAAGDTTRQLQERPYMCRLSQHCSGGS